MGPANPMPGLRDLAWLFALGALSAAVALGLIAVVASLVGVLPVLCVVAFVAGMVVSWLLGRGEREHLLERATRAEQHLALELAIQRNPFSAAGLPLDGALRVERQAGGFGRST